jgi:hypothetical protein
MMKPSDKKHARLLWFYDIFKISHQPGEPIDWQALWQIARSFGWELPLLAALYGAFARYSRRGAAGLLEEWFPEASADIRNKAQALGRLSDRKNYRMAYLKFPAAVKLVSANLLPAPAYMRWRYAPRPAWLLPLFYLYRWASWILGMTGALKLRVREHDRQQP